jgi:protoporphyrinogen oxidase
LSTENSKTAIIIGAGPAGLTAAYELLTKTDIIPIVFEATGDIGGISKTVNYKNNRIDIGGHRFFSKSDRVMKFWLDLMPLQSAPAKDDLILNRKLPDSSEILLNYHGSNRKLPEDTASCHDPEKEDSVMIFRQRISRIFFLRRFFSYPVSLTVETVKNLGLWRMYKIGCSYLKARLLQIKPEKSLEDFFINRFGRQLYKTFFKDYTEKVWGVPCSKISPEWGAQRIKGLSISSAIFHAIKKLFTSDKSVGQKGTETSLIEQFIYPKLGPGQFWELVADIIKQKGGQVHLNKKVIGLNHQDDNIKSLIVEDTRVSQTETVCGDYVFSTMAVKDLVNATQPAPPQDVKQIANGLVYRDFITVGLLLKKLAIENHTSIKTINNIIPDNWIYIQEQDVKLGRLQIFNNWSPYMVDDLNNTWIGLEYFCNEGDELWSMSDDDFKAFAIDELARIDIINKDDVLDSCVIKMPKTYPAYFGSYEQFDMIREYTDSFKNLFLIGRNGMHRYNNQDHSMLTAMTAVENIMSSRTDKANIWAVNTEEQYHESK